MFAKLLGSLVLVAEFDYFGAFADDPLEAVHLLAEKVESVCHNV